MDTDRKQRRGAAIRAARRAQGLTQEDLARVSGVSVSTIQNIERDAYTKPHPANLEALCEALGIDVPDVDGGDERAAAVRRQMPRDVEIFLDILGGWLSALDPERRQAEMKFLGQHIFGNGQDSP